MPLPSRAVLLDERRLHGARVDGLGHEADVRAPRGASVQAPTLGCRSVRTKSTAGWPVAARCSLTARSIEGVGPPPPAQKST